jgi:hypothetical protein
MVPSQLFQNRNGTETASSMQIIIAAVVKMGIVNCCGVSSEFGVGNGFGISKCDLRLHASLQLSILQCKAPCSSLVVVRSKW